MSKTDGMGSRLLVDEFDISGDVGAVSNIGSTIGFQEVTGLNKSAKERVTLLADSQLEFTGFFNPTGSHTYLKDLPNSNTVGTYLHKTAIGNPAFTGTFQQASYNFSRGQDASLTIESALASSDGEPCSWGQQLTTGIQTVTSTGNLTSVDLGAAKTGGYFTTHCTAFTGTDITLTFQDSTDDAAFNTVDASAVVTYTGVGAGKVVLTGVNVDRYIRLNISGTFTTATISVVYAIA